MDHKDTVQLQHLRSSTYETATYDTYNFHDYSTQYLLSRAGTGPKERRAHRISKRLLGVHLMHAVLLGITFSFLVLSIRHWEHGVAIPIDDATRIASVVTVVCQVFFTTTITMLYLLSGTAAVDNAIRHPQTLLDLDTRLAAWSGLGSALNNIMLLFPRLSSVPLSITLGIPLYFVCGEVLKVTSSSLLGVDIYNATQDTILPNSAIAHAQMLLWPNLRHTEFMAGMGDTCALWEPGKKFGLWQHARTNLFITNVTDTLHPGIKGRLLYDTLITDSLVFDSMRVNSTKMSVTCAQVEDATVKISIIPQDVSSSKDYFFDPVQDNYIEPLPLDYIQSKNASAARSIVLGDEEGYTIHSELFPSQWMNTTMSSYPPYWDSRWANATEKFAYAYRPRNVDIHTVVRSEPTILPAPWGWINPTAPEISSEFALPSPYVGISNQFVFTLTTRSRPHLLVDSTGSDGLVHTQHTVQGNCVDTCTSEMSNRECYESVSEGDECHKGTSYAQVIGCTLHTSQNTLTILQDGTVAPTDRNKNAIPQEHPWSAFKWEDPDESTDIIANEFLSMMVPYGCNPNAATPFEAPYFRHHDLLMSGLLGAGITNTRESLNRSTSLQDLEDMLEQVTASYLWNVLQSCPSNAVYPYNTGYDQCSTLSDGGTPKEGILNSVSLTRTETRARLEVVHWKAIIAFVANMGLLVLAFSLLGIRTDRKVGEPTIDARFVDQVALMKDSTLPNVVAEKRAGVEESASIRLRYTSRTTGDGQKIEVHTEI